MLFPEEKKGYWTTLLKDGALESIDSQRDIPEFYDQQIFRRGVDFVKQNIFAIFVGNVAGFITTITLKCVLDASRPIFSVDEMQLNLELMRFVFDLYNNVSEDEESPKKALWELKQKIEGKFSSQRDFVLWQFACSGYILSRPHLLGIDDQKNKDNLRAFNHVWRVLGHCCGLDDDRANLCAEDITETKDRILEMTPLLIGPVFLAHSNTYVKIILDFVDKFWYFHPILSMDSILFLSNRLAGIPGYYLSDEERHKDLVSIDAHQGHGYLSSFYRRKLECEIYSPKCCTFVKKLSWRDRWIITAVVHVFSRYSTSAIYKFCLNSLIWLGMFCKRQLSFLVVCLGFQSSYANIWTIRKAVMMMNLRDNSGGRRRRKGRSPGSVDKKDKLNYYYQKKKDVSEL